MLIEDLEMVRRNGSAIGLLLNEHKCELVTDDMEVVQKIQTIAPSITHVHTSNAVLLGAPIGSLEEIDVVLTKKISDFQLLACRLKLLCAHDALYLLKNCFSLPKLQYILRCSPCYNSQVLHTYDNLIRDTLQSILNVTLTESIWQQATLPVRNGGIGVWLATQVALPSFLSSVASSSELVLQLLPPRLHSSSGSNDLLFTAAVDLWRQQTGRDQLPEFIVTQTAWDTPLVEVAVERVLSAAPNQAGIARLLAAAAPHSGAFSRRCPVPLSVHDLMTRRCESLSRCVSVLQSAHRTNVYVMLTSIRRAFTVLVAASQQVVTRDTARSTTSSNAHSPQPKFHLDWNRRLCQDLTANGPMV